MGFAMLGRGVALASTYCMQIYTAELYPTVIRLERVKPCSILISIMNIMFIIRYTPPSSTLLSSG